MKTIIAWKMLYHFKTNIGWKPILVKHFQNLKLQKILSIEWKIIRKVFCDAKSNYCLLRLKEKYFIINYPHEDISLNKRSGLDMKIRIG